MRKWKLVGLLLAVALMTTGLSAVAQQDDVPILRPRVQPAKSTVATLLVTCDLACNWKLDGEAKGRIQAGGSAKANVVIGQHLVVATTPDDLDKVEKEVDIEAAKQTLVRIELTLVHDARVKAEQEARDKVAQEVIPAPDQLSRQNVFTGQSTRVARLQDLHDHAGEQYKEGMVLYLQKRYEEARALFEKACDGGEITGCYNLGSLYQNGQGVSQDYAQARTLDQKACDGGQMSGCNNLGQLYQYGQGVSQDYAHARMLYQKGCNGGEMSSCNNLGLLYQNGQGVSQDYAQARTLYQKACDGGEMSGCTNLGWLYKYGHGVSQDYSQARTLSQKACNGGEMTGCNNLGTFYQGGQGGTQDYGQARTLYQKACDGGEMMGCNNLGWLYQNGRGVSQDHAQARTLYQKACSGGEKQGCTNLSNLH